MTSNSANYMKHAAELIKGAIAEASDAMSESKAARDAAMWDATINLMCHAAVNVFHKGYTKKIAASFTAELVTASGLSEKQAFKYTSAISAAFGVRGVKPGMVSGGIKGLLVQAKEGPEDLRKFLAELPEPIKSLGTLNAALRQDVDKVEKIADTLFTKFTDDERDAVNRLIKIKLEAVAKAKEKADAKATKKNGAAVHTTA